MAENVSNAGHAATRWVTISELARAQGVDKSAVSRRVTRFEALGVLSTRKSGNTKLISLAEFDRAVAQAGDKVREANGRTKTAAIGDTETPPRAPPDTSLATAQARRVAIQTEIAQIDLDTRRGRIVDVDLVSTRLLACGLEMVRAAEALAARSDAQAPALVAAMAEGGPDALLTALRAANGAFLRDLREAIAQAAERFAEGDLNGAEAEVAA